MRRKRGPSWSETARTTSMAGTMPASESAPSATAWATEKGWPLASRIGLLNDRKNSWRFLNDEPEQTAEERESWPPADGMEQRSHSQRWRDHQFERRGAVGSGGSRHRT